MWTRGLLPYQGGKREQRGIRNDKRRAGGGSYLASYDTQPERESHKGQKHSSARKRGQTRTSLLPQKKRTPSRWEGEKSPQNRANLIEQRWKTFREAQGTRTCLPQVDCRQYRKKSFQKSSGRALPRNKDIKGQDLLLRCARNIKGKNATRHHSPPSQKSSLEESEKKETLRLAVKEKIYWTRSQRKRQPAQRAEIKNSQPLHPARQTREGFHWL